jgi:integrase
LSRPSLRQQPRVPVGSYWALRWNDVHLAGGSLSVQRSLVEGARSWCPRRHVAVIGWRLTARAVGFSGSIVAGLLTIQSRRNWPTDSSSASTGRDCALGCRTFVTKRFIRARRSAGLDHFRLHDLRHFPATEMLDAGVPVAIVEAHFCRTRASTALNVYAHAVRRR